MSFNRYDESGKTLRYRVIKEFVGEESESMTEQSHKDEVDINKIVARHGNDLTAQMRSLQNFRFDDVQHNDFQESMNAIIQARDTFEQVPKEIRRMFDNDPAKFLDYVHNPENNEQLLEWGLINPPETPPAPIEVAVVSSPETPPETT
jgi:phage internal scaffolding protein